MPKGLDWPQTSRDQDLHLLAQINFEEMPELSPFPKKGILQFWLASDDLYGLDFDNRTTQDSFRLIYFPETQHADLQTDFGDKLVWNEMSPFGPDKPSFELTFETKKMPAGYFDFQSHMLLKNLPENLDIEYMHEYDGSGHKIGGYAYFTQTDPRDSQTDYGEKKELLLQIDTDDKNQIMWGDAGVANFFISEEKLKNLDFSDVLYNWDCC